VSRTLLALTALSLSALVVTSCGEAAGNGPAQTVLTDSQRMWCSQHPEAHREAASALDISFVGDYIRTSNVKGGPDITGLEPPFLAVPSGDDEALSLRLQFENSEDFDRACQAALELLK